MNRGDMVELNMDKMLCVSKAKDMKTHCGTLQEYRIMQEEMEITLQEGTLMELSLDAIYICTIYSQTGKICCTGRVRERYCGEKGKTLVFHIDNGFFKINGNHVDKQIR